MTVTLREVTQEDLPIFFEHQLDAEATRMAAFPSRDRDAFMADFARIMSNETGILNTVTGKWSVRVTLKDNIRHVSLPLKTFFTLVEEKI